MVTSEYATILVRFVSLEIDITDIYKHAILSATFTAERYNS